MQYRTFGRDPVRVSEVGLGCWQFGGTEWGELSEDAALATLRAAAEAGVFFLDTADIYGLGRSERLIGLYRREHPDATPFIATKLGRHPDPGWPANFTWESFRKHTEASLLRLGVEALDLQQLHCVPPEQLERGDVFDWLRRLQREGKIRRWGASVESDDEARICLKHDGLASLQIIFNIYRQKPIVELFDEARHKGVAIIVRLPLASGLLSGRYTKSTTFAPTDHRTFNRDGEKFNVGETFAGLPFQRGVELTQELKALLPPGDMAQWALRWCLDFDAVTVVIPGARNAAQVRSNAAASDLPPLPPEAHRRIRDFYDAEVAGLIRGPY
jgi:aryl-alcohol dehydrogenase-like predicted oxidoreductase